MDKLIQSTAKFCIEIVQKENCLNIQQLHKEDSETDRSCRSIQFINDLSPNTAPNDFAYRKKVENALEEEFLFRITVSRSKNISHIGIQLMNIDEDDEEEELMPQKLNLDQPVSDSNEADEAAANLASDSEFPEITQQNEIPVPKPLFLKRNVIRVQSRDPLRERRFTTTPGSISVSKSISVSNLWKTMYH